MVEVKFIWTDEATGKQLGARLYCYDDTAAGMYAEDLSANEFDVDMTGLQVYKRHLRNAEVTDDGLQAKYGKLPTCNTDVSPFASKTEDWGALRADMEQAIGGSKKRRSKKTVPFGATFALLVAIALSISTIFAFAETKPVLNEDDQQRIAIIENAYNITLKISKHSKDADLSRHLSNIEAALSYLGSDFTAALTAAYDEGSFFLNLRPLQGISGGYFYTGDRLGEVELFGSNDTPVNKFNVLHELGHALQYAVRGDAKLPEPFSSETYEGTRSATAQTDYPTRFSDTYAEVSEREDYAQCFYYAVLNGADNPIKFISDTPIYQKTLIVYYDLLSFAGSDAKATQRMADYLGIN